MRNRKIYDDNLKCNNVRVLLLHFFRSKIEIRYAFSVSAVKNDKLGNIAIGIIAFKGTVSDKKNFKITLNDLLLETLDWIKFRRRHLIPNNKELALSLSKNMFFLRVLLYR